MSRRRRNEKLNAIKRLLKEDPVLADELRRWLGGVGITGDGNIVGNNNQAHVVKHSGRVKMQIDTLNVTIPADELLALLEEIEETRKKREKTKKNERLMKALIAALFSTILLLFSCFTVAVLIERSGLLVSTATSEPMATYTPLSVALDTPSPAPSPSNTPQPVSTSSAAPTSTPSPAPTNTMIPTSVPSSTPEPTSTSTPTPTPIPTPISVSQLSILYEDDFSNSNRGWTLLMDYSEYYLMRYQDGLMALRIFPDSYKRHDLVYPGLQLRDFVVEVDVQNLTGVPSARMGVAFRADYFVNMYGDVSRYYVFTLSSGGACEFGIYDSMDVDLLMDPMTCSNISPEGPNRIHIEARGGQYRFFVNGQLVGEYEDIRYEIREMHFGDIGLYSADPNNVGTYVGFDNFVVASLP